MDFVESFEFPQQYAQEESIHVPELEDIPEVIEGTIVDVNEAMSSPTTSIIETVSDKDLFWITLTRGLGFLMFAVPGVILLYRFLNKGKNMAADFVYDRNCMYEEELPPETGSYEVDEQEYIEDAVQEQTVSDIRKARNNIYDSLNKYLSTKSAEIIDTPDDVIAVTPVIEIDTLGPGPGADKPDVDSTVIEDGEQNAVEDTLKEQDIGATSEEEQADIEGAVQGQTAFDILDEDTSDAIIPEDVEEETYTEHMDEISAEEANE